MLTHTAARSSPSSPQLKNRAFVGVQSNGGVDWTELGGSELVDGGGGGFSSQRQYTCPSTR